MEKEKILGMVDHTILKQDATWDDVKNLINDAINFHTYSVCISPCFVKQAKKYIGSQNMKICTVIGFPNGVNTTNVKMIETNEAICNGVNEIDMVINIGKVKEKDYDYIRNELKSLVSLCHRPNSNVILKVIVETALLTEDEIRDLTYICQECKVDFIKTSTGFSTRGASFRDVEIMSEEISKMQGTLKIKAAGGISSFEDAQKFIDLGASRLGTSRLVKIAKEN